MPGSQKEDRGEDNNYVFFSSQPDVCSQFAFFENNLLKQLCTRGYNESFICIFQHFKRKRCHCQANFQIQNTAIENTNGKGLTRSKKKTSKPCRPKETCKQPQEMHLNATTTTILRHYKGARYIQFLDCPALQ